MTIATNKTAAVEVLAFAAFYNEGARGAKGGAASNDKVWGIAKVNGTLVNFWGRRNGVMKFKTFFQTEANKVWKKWDEKTGARRDGGDIYTAVHNAAMRDTLVPNLVQQVTHYFYSAMARGTLNTAH
jgi:hypothetical protein